MPINDKQRHFIREYTTNGHNASKAYSKAYPDCISGHRQAGSALLTNLDIRQEIDRIEAKSEAKVDITRELLVAKMYAIIEDNTSNKADMTRAASLIADMCGYKREAAPNQEKERAILARMSSEDKELAQLAAKLRTDAETRKGLKLA